MYNLTRDELRAIVIRAVQAHDNWRNGAFGQNTQNRDLNIEPPAAQMLLTSEREACIDRSGPLVSSSAPKISLFPGGGYLIVQWSHGFVQLVDIIAQKAIWTYPDLPSSSAQMSMRHWAHNSLCYDVAFHGNGYANIAVSYWKVGADGVYLGLKELWVHI